MTRLHILVSSRTPLYTPDGPAPDPPISLHPSEPLPEPYSVYPTNMQSDIIGMPRPSVATSRSVVDDEHRPIGPTQSSSDSHCTSWRYFLLAFPLFSRFCSRLSNFDLLEHRLLFTSDVLCSELRLFKAEFASWSRRVSMFLFSIVGIFYNFVMAFAIHSAIRVHRYRLDPRRSNMLKY